MSDERLREAERRWNETGSVEDEARYLQERVRVGDLTRERLELAAYCGHEGARKTVGASVGGLVAQDMPYPWIYGLDDWVKDQDLRREIAVRIVNMVRSWLSVDGAQALDGALGFLERGGGVRAAVEGVVEVAPWLGQLIYSLDVLRPERSEAERRSCMFLLFGTLAAAFEHQGQSDVAAENRAGETLARECVVAALA